MRQSLLTADHVYNEVVEPTEPENGVVLVCRCGLAERVTGVTAVTRSSIDVL